MEVHFNVGDGSNPADWSVVAWGESGPVYVHNTGADASDHWPTDPKHRTPSGGKPETWDATKPQLRDLSMTKAPKAKKSVAIREKKWYIDPIKALNKNVAKLAPVAKSDAYSRKPTDPATMEEMTKMVEKYVPKYLSEESDAVWRSHNFKREGGKDKWRTLGNNNPDPKKFVVFELDLPNKAAWDNLVYAGNVPLDKVSVFKQERGKTTATISFATNMHLVLLSPPGTNVSARYMSL